MWQPRPGLSRLRGGSLLADKALGVPRVSELRDQEVAITGVWVKPRPSRVLHTLCLL